ALGHRRRFRLVNFALGIQDHQYLGARCHRVGLRDYLWHDPVGTREFFPPALQLPHRRHHHVGAAAFWPPRNLAVAGAQNGCSLTSHPTVSAGHSRFYYAHSTLCYSIERLILFAE